MANWFEEFENRPIRGKDQVPWLVTIEYEIQSKFFVSSLSFLPDINRASDSKLFSAAQHCNNLFGWVEQMRIMGYTGLPGVIEDLLEEKYGNRQHLTDLRRAYTEKWLKGKSGQHNIGENNFTIYRDKFYYYSLRHEWREVEPSSIFNIMPKFGQKADSQISELLSAEYKPTRFQQVYMSWKDTNYSGKLPVSSAKTGQTTPEDVLKDTLGKVQAIIENPPALEEVNKATSAKTDYLEYLIKISCLVADFAQHRRTSNEFSLYLLRDCAMFHEAQIIIDLVEGQQTSHDQAYIGRQSLSSRLRDAGHWYVCQELLLLSLQKYPNDFPGFYEFFTQRLRDYEKYSPEFGVLVQNLAKYLSNHIDEAKQSNLTINVIDLGFQGSINMLVKYVLDEYCLHETKLPTKVHMYIVAEWFKGVYQDMYTSNTFSALTDIEVLSRNNAIYEYVNWSLRDGRLDVAYGSKADQNLADIELTVMTMTILLTKNSKTFKIK